MWLFAVALAWQTRAGEPPRKPSARRAPWKKDLLTEKFTAPGGVCKGWGQWATPFIIANSGDEAVRLSGGAITVPASSVLVHPGAERDVGIVWRSPISGKVRVRARAAHAHPSGGDGVSWAISCHGKNGRKTLARGTIDRGGSQAIPATAQAGKLDAVVVEKDESLVFMVGPRGSHQCDSTVVGVALTEIGGSGRVWDLAEDLAGDLTGDLIEDLAGDIQSGNPHADSLGNATVWYLVAPNVRRGGGQVEESLMTVGPKAGERIDAWTVATDDTKLAVGATREGQLVIYELSHPAAGWNWAAEPLVFPLPDKVAVNDVVREIRWKFKKGRIDKAAGRKATLCFVCEEPALELTSEWWARPGRGPVRHALRIANRSDGPVKVFDPITMHLDLAAGNDDGELSMWTFHTGGGTPDKTGVYRDAVEPPFSRQIRTHSGGEFIPYAVFDTGGKQGVYVGIEWGYCRIAGVVPEDRPAGWFRVRGGEFAGFHIDIGPGQAFDAPVIGQIGIPVIVYRYVPVRV